MTHTLRSPIARNLRTELLLRSGDRIRSQHSYQLVAAYFGYNTDAALMADLVYPLDRLTEAQYLIPDIALMKKRLSDIYDLPLDDMSAYAVARTIGNFIKDNVQFNGQIWIADTLEAALIDEVGNEFISEINDELSGEMATTNAMFDELILEDGNVNIDLKRITFELSGVYHGEQDRDRPFSGSDMRVRVVGNAVRVATNICFGKFEIVADGNVVDF